MFNVLFMDPRCCEIKDLFCFYFWLLCICIFVLEPLVFVGAEGESADLRYEMARCTVAVTVTTCVNGLSLIGLSYALLGLLCPFVLIATYFYSQQQERYHNKNIYT